MFIVVLPARLCDARELALEGSLAEADPAEREAAHEGPGAAADEAAVVALNRVLRRSLRLGDHRLLGHGLPPRPRARIR